MHRRKSSVLAAVIPLAAVMCVSLAIVGSIVTWMAAQEGVGLADLATQLFRGQQSARPFVAQSTRLPTRTPLHPSPTPIPTATASLSQTFIEPTPTLKPTEPPAINNPTPHPAISIVTPNVVSSLQSELVVQ